MRFKKVFLCWSVGLLVAVCASKRFQNAANCCIIFFFNLGGVGGGYYKSQTAPPECPAPCSATKVRCSPKDRFHLF